VRWGACHLIIRPDKRLPGGGCLVLKSFRLTGIVSSPATENISLYRNSELRYKRGQPVPPRGTLRGRHETWRGLRWTLGASGASAPDETFAAYGEIVWSWRRDRGVYPPLLFGCGNGDNQRRSPGRARISRKAIARGRPGCPGCTCQTRVRLLTTHCTRCCGCRRRPAFPAPSVQEGQRRCKPRAIVSRE